MQAEPTRGGRKLDAAIRHFELAGRVRGAAAVDIGASTGGFVAVLLENGAAAVTAIDVGHGQLAPELIANPKVTHLEGADFKTLSLTTAAGPFDFFSVDVSFVAARSMLRGLAFRLRPGALGVVLVKPQFELPSNLVKGGMVADPTLRKRALDTFLAKAARLGFSALGHFDSPVPGGSGTVEILVHLRFDGRPDSMPKLGERKPKRAAVAGSDGANRKGSGRGFIGHEHRWFAVAAPGLEPPLRAELANLSQVRDARVVEGGVEFAGPVVAGMAANLHSHIATRILLRLGEVKARDFAPLRRALAKLPWSALVPTDRPVRVDVSTSHCRLFHTGALAETVELAVTDCVGKLPVRDKGAAADDEHATRILLRGQDDVFTASVDSSGELLHRRGWRLEAGRAPLRETLAAGILALCEYDAKRPLVDLMCGSGTFVVEAASLARQRAPGIGRAFAFERWPSHDPEAWMALRETAPAAQPASATILGFDRDRRAIEIARANAERAQLADAIQFAALPFDQAKVDCEPGLIVMNPPYGHRLGDRRHAMQVARKIGDELAARFRGWRAGVLCPDPAFVATLGKGARRQPLASHALRNGGLRVMLAIWAL
jgi:putative N6-adenine-specific DNA methylase